jgi:hypothetical protein
MLDGRNTRERRLARAALADYEVFAVRRDQSGTQETPA